VLGNADRRRLFAACIGIIAMFGGYRAGWGSVGAVLASAEELTLRGARHS
jgi:hypothetical protein